MVFLFCSCLFLIQLFRILPNYLDPTLTNTVVKNVPLKSMDFPLDFKVCFQPAGFNETALRSYGYEDSVAYIDGIRNYFDSAALIGWGGHGHGNQPGGVKNASEVLHAAKKDWTMSQIFNFFQVGPHLENQSALLQRINWISDCYLLNLDIIKEDHLRGMGWLWMMFNDTLLEEHNVTIELKLQGQNIAVHRVIQDHLFYHTGDPIKLDKFSSYRVKIKKMVVIEGEPGNTCRNYPNSDFESYRDCDDNYMKTTLQNAAPGLNLTPVWMTDDLSKVTTTAVAGSLHTIGKCNQIRSIRNSFDPRCP